MINGIPIQLTCLITISVGVCLFLLKYFVSRILKSSGIENGRPLTDNSQKQQKNTEHAVSTNKFEAEINGLRNLIINAGGHYKKYGYDLITTNTFIDEKCKRYVDIFIPIVAVSPGLYDLLINERPSLKPYLQEKISKYLLNRPSESEVEEEFIKILEKTKIFTKTENQQFDLNHFVCVQVMVDKYGFSQEVLHVANKIDADLFTVLIRLYDRRIQEFQTVDDPQRY